MYLTNDIFEKSLPSKITDNIFLGCVFCSENESNLKELEITHIITAGLTLNCNYPDKFTYLKLNITDKDNEDLSKSFLSAYTFIEDCLKFNGKILVHCAFGISRSPAIIISYFIKKYKWKYEEAFEFIKSKRKHINPNNGFVKQLKAYYSYLYDDI